MVGLIIVLKLPTNSLIYIKSRESSLTSFLRFIYYFWKFLLLSYASSSCISQGKQSLTL